MSLTVKASDYFSRMEEIHSVMFTQIDMNIWKGVRYMSVSFLRNSFEVWYERNGGLIYVRIIDQPNTLSGNILRQLVELPPIVEHSEFVGDIIRPIPFSPPPPDDDSDDDKEDITEDLQTLPIVDFDEKLHFAKHSRYRSEIANLLKVKGLSPNLIQLLGRTEDGRLVFPRAQARGITLLRMQPNVTLSKIKRCCVDLADALRILHSLDIVHRDLEGRNLLASLDWKTVILCDLESRWGTHKAPQLRPFENKQPHETPYSKETDVYNFGYLLNSFLIGNNARSPWVEMEAPEPFASIARACKAEAPEDRPTMEEVKAMLNSIVIEGKW